MITSSDGYEKHFGLHPTCLNESSRIAADSGSWSTSKDAAGRLGTTAVSIPSNSEASTSTCTSMIDVRFFFYNTYCASSTLFPRFLINSRRLLRYDNLNKLKVGANSIIFRFSFSHPVFRSHKPSKRYPFNIMHAKRPVLYFYTFGNKAADERSHSFVRFESCNEVRSRIIIHCTRD